MIDPKKAIEEESEEEWDEEDEEPGRPGPRAARLNTNEDPVEIAREIFRAGKPDLLDEEEDDGA
jgi:hypothetical protein